MNELDEEFLSAWLRMTGTISNERIVSRMSFNEAFVCNILYNQSKETPDKLLTATDLCERTHMHKTLMNRTLKSLEKKGLITRQQNVQDKRQSFIFINYENISLFMEEHNNSLKIVKRISDKLGKERVKEAISIFGEMSDIVEEIM